MPTEKRQFRQNDIAKLRHLWLTARKDKTPGINADEVLNRLEQKYQILARASNRPS
jgi:antitoxin ParD1/3/4